MTVTVKLITEQTTNLLEASVNKAQANGWYPVCGVVYFNARYTQLMVRDTDDTTPPACDYFIVDAEDDVSFSQRVNQLLEINPGAVCLSSVQYAQARYIQAYGDDAMATKFYVDSTRPVNTVFRASFTTTNLVTTQYVTADNTPQVVTFNAQALPNAALGTLNNATGIFTAARRIVGTLAVTCQVRRTTGGSAAVTWGFQVETSPDGVTWTPTAGSARYINLRGAGDNNVLQTTNLTVAVDIPAGTRVRITQMTDTSSANVGLVALPAMLGGATAAGLVFSLSTTI